jgi:hypothetical protein
MIQHSPIGNAFDTTFLALQTWVVVFLLFHDWIPLGHLNNLAAIRSQDTLLRRIFVTLLAAAQDILGYPTRTGWRCCSGLRIACSSSACFVPGGYLTCSYRTQSGPHAIKVSSPARIRSCLDAMEWPRTLYIPYFI